MMTISELLEDSDLFDRMPILKKFGTPEDVRLVFYFDC